MVVEMGTWGKMRVVEKMLWTEVILNVVIIIENIGSGVAVILLTVILQISISGGVVGWGWRSIFGLHAWRWRWWR